MFSDDINIKKILFSKFNLLGKLCSQSNKNNQVNIIFNQILININPDLARHTKVAALSKNTLHLETSRSEYLTQLRFLTTDLLSELRKHPDFYQLIAIKFKVNPELSINNSLQINSHFNNSSQYSSRKSQNIIKKPGASASKDIQNIAENIKNSKLKQALLKLTKKI